MKKHSSERSLRIIGGSWRSRKISFPDRDDIRPTPDRVRETLFNWLGASITGSRCLELYAGSGALSMEALSRGAGQATLIERDHKTWTCLGENLARLTDDRSGYRCIRGEALDWVRSSHEVFDVVFLDPPFDSIELVSVLEALVTGGNLAEDSRVYLETPTAVDSSNLPPPLVIIRQGRAGHVHYCLCANER